MSAREPVAARIRELEERAYALVEYGNSLPDGVTTEAFAEASNLRHEAWKLRQGDVAATLPEKLRQKAWLFLRRRDATFEDEAAANLMLRAAKALEADRGS